MMRKIKCGDTVMVMRGKDKGRTGKVLKVDPKKGKAIVEGLNLARSHAKRRRASVRTEESVPRPIPLCALALVSKRDGKPVRVRFEEQETSGKPRKVRVATRTGEVMD